MKFRILYHSVDKLFTEGPARTGEEFTVVASELFMGVVYDTGLVTELDHGLFQVIW